MVIPIAGVVLAPNLHLRARITEAATNVLNIAGVVAILLLLWDVARAFDPSRRRFRFRVGLWIVLFVTLAALFPLHYWLERLDPVGGTGPVDKATFYPAHQIYLWVSTVQWLAALVYLGVTLRAWRAEDAKALATEQLSTATVATPPSDERIMQ